MILTYQHKFLFLRPPKSSGASLEVALADFCGADDLITPINKNVIQENISNPLVANHMPALEGPKHGLNNPWNFESHTPYKEVELYYDLTEFTTISITRNPFEKLVSRYYHYLENSNWSEQTYQFKRFLSAMLKNYTVPNGYIHKDLAVHDNAWDKIDMWVRYDHLKEDILCIENKFKLVGLYKKFKTLNLHGNYHRKCGSSTNCQVIAEFYEMNHCLDLVPTIQKIYSEEIARFNYKLR